LYTPDNLQEYGAGVGAAAGCDLGDLASTQSLWLAPKINVVALVVDSLPQP
jgi:hypothetical protein